MNAKAFFAFIATLVITFFAGWITVLVEALSNSDVTLALFSIFLAPIAAIYGMYLWF